MIGSVNETLCNGCNQCVVVCPRDVFEPTSAVPVIARAEDCQTCFLCELYCREDALYVHPDVRHVPTAASDPTKTEHLAGEYRRESGWDEWALDDRFTNQHWRMEDVFRRARGV